MATFPSTLLLYYFHGSLWMFAFGSNLLSVVIGCRKSESNAKPVLALEANPKPVPTIAAPIKFATAVCKFPLTKSKTQ